MPPEESCDSIVGVAGGIAVRVRGLDLGYDVGSGFVPLLSGCRFDACVGEVTAIIGPSGSGKTSLLRVIAGIQTPQNGAVAVRGTTALVYQDSRLVRFLSVSDNLRLAGDLAKVLSTDSEIAGLLGAVGLAGFGSRMPETLSGGEAQRVAIARALMTRAAVLLIDEPTATLDRATAVTVASVLDELCRASHLALVVATHDPIVIERASTVIDLTTFAVGSFR